MKPENRAASRNVGFCGGCVHFIQHYVRVEDPAIGDQEFVKVCCGHCVFPRLKYRNGLNEACSHYFGREREQAPDDLTQEDVG